LETTPAHQRLDMRYALPLADGKAELAVGGEWLLDYMTRTSDQNEIDRVAYVTYRHTF
jgi:hypothetical protein